jgi:hypothetical protein
MSLTKVPAPYTMTMTWTLHCTEPLTDEEKKTIVGNLFEHIGEEAGAGIEGFEKVERICYPAEFGWSPRTAEEEAELDAWRLKGWLREQSMGAYPSESIGPSQARLRLITEAPSA